MKRVLGVACLMSAMLAGTQVANAADFPRDGQAEAFQSADARDGVKIGYLDCHIGGGVGYVLGSAKELDCVFHPSVDSPRADSYTGIIRKLGIDLGFTTRGRLVWAVFAPTAGYHQGSLSGLYKGATVEATLGAGVGANVLVGGTAGSVHLQMISATGQLGLNVAAAGTSVTLTSLN